MNDKTDKKILQRILGADAGIISAQLLLCMVILASCGINLVHGLTKAADAGDGTSRIAAAGTASVVAPVVFFALTEVALLNWHRELPRIGRWFLSALVLIVGAAAGWFSFMDQVEFARTILHMGDDDLRAFALPFITDCAAVAMTALLFMSKDAPMRKRKPKTSTEDTPIARIGALRKMWIRMFGGVATVPQLPVTATVPQVTAESTSRRQANDIVPSTPEPVFDTRESTPTRVANTKPVTSAPTPSRVADAETPNVEVTVFDAELLEFAAEVAERAKVRQPVETVAKVIEALEETGGNLSHAAGRVGLSRDPARRIRAALAEINGNQEPELVAV